jgi:hypothetical protein
MGLGNSREALRSAVKAKTACIGMIKQEASAIIKEEITGKRIPMKSEISEPKDTSESHRSKSLKGFIVNLKSHGVRSEGVQLEAIVDKLLGEIIDLRLKR